MRELYENKSKSQKELAKAIVTYSDYYSVSSPFALAKFLTEEGFTRREKAKLIAPSYIQGRKFEHIYHCSLCNGIPYGGVGEDSHFCMVCGAEIEEIINGN